MNSVKIFSFLLIPGIIALASCSNNNSKTTTTDSTSTVSEKITAAVDTAKAALTPDPNKSFANDAASDNMKELAWLQAGIDHGTNKELKAHAKMMLKDHAALAGEVNVYAAKKAWQLPTVDTIGLATLADKPGKEWDNAWVDKMVDAHQDAIDKFEKAQGQVTDPDLKAIIDKTLPTLHSHYDMMKKMQDNMSSMK